MSWRHVSLEGPLTGGGGSSLAEERVVRDVVGIAVSATLMICHTTHKQHAKAHACTHACTINQQQE